MGKDSHQEPMGKGDHIHWLKKKVSINFREISNIYLGSYFLNNMKDYLLVLSQFRVIATRFRASGLCHPSERSCYELGTKS